MSKPPDDLEAVRTVLEALKSFDARDQERIIRWVREKLGLPSSPQEPIPPTTITPRLQPPQPTIPGHPSDIKTFVSQKNPASDNQLAATVAYYYRFEAPEAERKDSISGDDLQEACRRAGRPRLKNPGQTLRNAHSVGLLDKTERGSFSINTVGENLVAMTLPGGEIPSAARRKRTPKKQKPSTARAKRSKEKKSSTRE